jgi:tRNA threonylcarbamoyladenosine biosynthesis protein TsaE
MEKIVTKNEKETFRLGSLLGKGCRGGEVFVLCGDLGAGKTKFLQGLAAGLGVKSRVNSPTFNILKIYKIMNAAQNKNASKIKIFCHIDAYRLKSAHDLISLGVKEFFDQSDVVTAIEWADKVKKIWPKKARVIKMKQLSENEREIIYF